MRGRTVLDVGCGRGGAAALMADLLKAKITGIDLSPQAIVFFRSAHRQATIQFDVGNAENLPARDNSFDIITNIESSHAYPVEKFFREVGRVLIQDGQFLYADLLPSQLWAEVRELLKGLRFSTLHERSVTDNVVAACDVELSECRKEFGRAHSMMDDFAAGPGSSIYERMRSGELEYRILRLQKTG